MTDLFLNEGLNIIILQHVHNNCQGDIPEEWGDLALGSIGGMMGPDAAGFDLKDDNYKAGISLTLALE